MKKKKFILSLLSLGLLFTIAGCQDNAKNEIDCGNINVVAKDATNNQAISGVKLTLMVSKGKSITTDSFGRATYDNIRIGEYKILCEKSGYASMYYEADLDYSSLKDKVAAESQTITAFMFPTTATIKGRVFEQDYLTSARNKASKAFTLDVAFSTPVAEFANNIRVAVTNGEYTIFNAPLLSSYRILPQKYYEGDYIYSAGSINGNITFASLSIAADLTYTKSPVTQVYLSNVSNIRVTDQSSYWADIAWNAVTFANYYEIYASNSLSGGYSEMDYTSSLYTTVYYPYRYFKVIAVNNSGITSDINSASVLTVNWS